MLATSVLERPEDADTKGLGLAWLALGVSTSPEEVRSRLKALLADCEGVMDPPSRNAS